MGRTETQTVTREVERGKDGDRGSRERGSRENSQEEPGSNPRRHVQGPCIADTFFSSELLGKSQYVRLHSKNYFAGMIM